MKNTTYIEKCLEFDAVTYVLTFPKSGTVAYNTKKNRILLKKGVFYWASKSVISVEKGVCFFRPKYAKKGVFFKLGYERGIRFGREGWGVCVVCVCVGGVGVGGWGGVGGWWEGVGQGWGVAGGGEIIDAILSSKLCPSFYPSICLSYIRPFVRQSVCLFVCSLTQCRDIRELKKKKKKKYAKIYQTIAYHTVLNVIHHGIDNQI